MKPENQYWQYIFLHEKQMAIIEAAPFAVDLLISPLRSVSCIDQGVRRDLQAAVLADQDGLIEPSQIRPGKARGPVDCHCTEMSAHSRPRPTSHLPDCRSQSKPGQVLTEIDTCWPWRFKACPEFEPKTDLGISLGREPINLPG
jgi:hypothetical protein